MLNEFASIMISGHVNSFYQAVIPLVFLASDGFTLELSGTIDTGFTGFISLPINDILRLGFVHVRSEPYTMGNNNEEDFDVFSGQVVWNSIVRRIEVLAIEGPPLVGMYMLIGNRYFMDVYVGGPVHIDTVD